MAVLLLAPPASADFPAALVPALLAVSLAAVVVVHPVFGPDHDLPIDFMLDYASPGAQRMLGILEREPRGMLTLFPNARDNGLFDFYCRVFSSDETDCFSLNYQADGIDNYFYLAAIRQHDQLLVSFTDTADQPRGAVEEALRQSQAREQAARLAAEERRTELQCIFEQAPVAIAVLRGPTLVAEVANPHVLQLWGLGADQIMGRPLFKALPEGRFQGCEELFDEVQRTGLPVVAHARPVTLRRFGRVETPYFDFVYQPLRDQQGVISGVIVIATEVTEQVQTRQQIAELNAELAAANEQLRASNAALEQRVSDRTNALLITLRQLEKRSDELAQALIAEQELGEMKSRFVTMASHEFRTPLAVVLSSATLVGKYPHREQQTLRLTHLARIRATVNHLNDILEEFLSVGRIEEGKVEANPVPFDLNVLVAEIVTDARPTLKTGQTIQQQLHCPDFFRLDASLLRKILVNLLSNALKYSGEHSVVSVRADCHDNWLALCVQDQGVGISEEDQAHLFERFFRSSNVANIHGTGLGLHIIARYLELMGGTIALVSQLNVGTTFTLSIPYENHPAD